jgi:hypothetical protein
LKNITPASLCTEYFILNTLKDFLFRSKTSVAEDENLQENPKVLGDGGK